MTKISKILNFLLNLVKATVLYQGQNRWGLLRLNGGLPNEFKYVKNGQSYDLTEKNVKVKNIFLLG
jgi:hypothetical protein